MNEQQPKLKVGDSVVVKPGTKDPDTGGDISGWQGRITDFSADANAPTVGIRWDSITLKNILLTTLQHSEPEYSEQIVVSEVGAFIPRKLFGQKEQIVKELAQAGVFAPEPEPPRCGVRRVAPVDITRETQWLQEHRHEYIGQWVALDGDRLVSHGTNARAVSEAARAAGVELPFFIRIEPAAEAPFGGW